MTSDFLNNLIIFLSLKLRFVKQIYLIILLFFNGFEKALRSGNVRQSGV